MIDRKFFDDLTKKISDCMPSGIKDVKQDVEKNIRATLHSAFNKMDLVTREEFDAQTNVLARSRAKLEALEKRVKELEIALNPAKTTKTKKSSGKKDSQ